MGIRREKVKESKTENIDQIEIKSILERLKKLERAVFGKREGIKKERFKNENFSGATGGIRLLISQGFFKIKRTLSDIRRELAKNDYHYSIQAAQTALNRLSKPGSSLVALKGLGKKVYVKRK